MQDSLRIAVTTHDQSTAPHLRRLILSQARGPVTFVDRDGADVVICDRAPRAGKVPGRTVVIDPAAAGARRRTNRALARAKDGAELRTRTPRAEALVDALLERNDIGQALIGRGGTLLRANGTLAKLLDVDRRELEGRHVDDLLEPGELRHDLRTFERTGAGAQRVLVGERRYRVNAGPATTLRSSVTAIADHDGQTTHLLVRAEARDSADTSPPAADDRAALLAAIRRIQAVAMRGSDARIVFNESLRQFQRLTGSPDALLGLVEPDGDGRQRLRPIAVQSPRGFLGQDRVGTADGLALDECCPEIARAIASRRPAWTTDAGDLWTAPDGALAAQGVLVLPIGLEGPSSLIVILANAADGYGASTVERLDPFAATCAWILSNRFDADRRAAVEEELIESRRTLESMLAHLPVMVYRCADDAQRSLQFVSEGCRELTGLSPDQMLDDPWGAWMPFVHSADRRQVLEAVRWSVLQGQRFELTYRTVGADGEERWVWEQGQGVRSSDGELLFVEGFAIDVTDQRQADEDRRRLESRLRRTHKLESLAVLADGIAHDFNNLLVGVLGHAQLLRGQVGGDRASSTALAAIERSVQRAADLTEHMLSYTGQGTAVLAPVDPADALLNARPMLERLMPKGGALAVDVDPTVPPVTGDASLLQRAAVELVRNAAEALPAAGGTVTLRCRAGAVSTEDLAEAWLGARLPAGDYVTVDVIDNGAGMAETVRQRAFDPFFSTRGAGRGMGLAAVLGAVRAHGGAVHLAPGRDGGTRVTLILPPAKRSPQDDRGNEVAVRPRGSRGATILIVDDEAVVREVAECALTRAGYRVLCAEDGEDALVQFDGAEGSIDAVLLDLTMPRMGGEATFEELRRRQSDLPVLLSSGFAEQAVMDRWSSRAGVHFLHKPYRLDDLIARLERALASGEPAP